MILTILANMQIEWNEDLQKICGVFSKRDGDVEEDDEDPLEALFVSVLKIWFHGYDRYPLR